MLAAYFLDGALVMDLEYDVGLYTDQMARRLLADYRRLLTNINLSLDDSPYTVPMLDESRCAQLTVEESRRELPPAGRSAVERIFERASSTPRATAVRELAGLEISYAELEGRVRRLSGVLQARGVERGVVVGVLLPRSIDAVVSLLAVHVAGGAFVPLDPAAPRQRLEFIVRDSGAKVVLVCGETRGRLESAHEIELDIESPAVRRAQEPPGPLAFPEFEQSRLCDLHLGVDRRAQRRVCLAWSAGESPRGDARPVRARSARQGAAVRAPDLRRLSRGDVADLGGRSDPRAAQRRHGQQRSELLRRRSGGGHHGPQPAHGLLASAGARGAREVALVPAPGRGRRRAGFTRGPPALPRGRHRAHSLAERVRSDRGYDHLDVLRRR